MNLLSHLLAKEERIAGTTVVSRLARLAIEASQGRISTMEMLDIVSITRDDYDGIAATLASCRSLRAQAGVRQIVVDSSAAEVEGHRAQELAAVGHHWSGSMGCQPPGEDDNETVRLPVPIR